MTWHVFDSPLLKILLLTTMIKINKMMFCTFIKKKKLFILIQTISMFFFFFISKLYVITFQLWHIYIYDCQIIDIFLQIKDLKLPQLDIIKLLLHLKIN